MRQRNGVLFPMVMSGTATAVRLLIAVLAFVGAYVGVEAARDPRAATAPSPTVTLSSRPAAVTTEPAAVASARPLVAGEIEVSVTALPGAGCDREIRTRTLLVNPDPAGTLMYGWRLERRSEATGDWKTYLTAHSGFAGAREVAEWRPRVTGNPGVYRIRLTATDDVDPLRSARFEITC